jgi:hypothetical protein
MTINNERVPKDVLSYAFYYLDPVSLGTCCKVDKRWKIVASDPRLWGLLVSRFGIIEYLNRIPSTALCPESAIGKFRHLHEIGFHIIGSEEQLVKLINKVINTIRLNQKGVTICDFPGLAPLTDGATPCIKVTLGYGNITPTSAPDIHVRCVVCIDGIDEGMNHSVRLADHTPADEIDRDNFTIFSIELIPQKRCIQDIDYSIPGYAIDGKNYLSGFSDSFDENIQNRVHARIAELKSTYTVGLIRALGERAVDYFDPEYLRIGCEGAITLGIMAWTLLQIDSLASGSGDGPTAADVVLPLMASSFSL